MLNQTKILPHYSFGSVPRSQLPCCSVSRKLINEIAIHLNEFHRVSYCDEFWVNLLQPHVQILLEQLIDAKGFLSRLSTDEVLAFFNRPLDVDTPQLDHEYRLLIHSLASFEAGESSHLNEVPVFKAGSGFSRKPDLESQRDLALSSYFRLLSRGLRRLSRLSTTLSICLGHFRNIDIVFFQKIVSENAAANVSRHLLRHGHKSARLFNVDIVAPIKAFRCQKEKSKLFREKTIRIDDELGLGSLQAFLEEHILSTLPDFAVEDFLYYQMLAKRLDRSHIVCKCPVANEPLLRHIVAQKAHTNQIIITFQHGGGYRVLSSPHIDLEYIFSDVFYGWSDSRAGVGSITHPSFSHDAPQEKRGKNTGNHVLIIGTSLKSFFRYNLGILPTSNTEFIRKTIRLISLLESNGLPVVYRPYTDNHDMLCELLPGLNVDRSDLCSQVESAGAVIVCKPTTIVEQVLLMNRVPFLFWGDEVCMEQAAYERLNTHPLSSLYTSDPDVMCRLIVDCVVHDKYPDRESLLPSLSHLFGTSISSPDSVSEKILKAIGERVSGKRS